MNCIAQPIQRQLMIDPPTYDMKTRRWSHDWVHEVPRNERGQYVPAVAVADDQPAVIDKHAALHLGLDRRCGTCGGPMGDMVWFILSPRSKLPVRFGPNGRRHIHFMEKVSIRQEDNPPMHLACAELTLTGGCPMMSGPGNPKKIALGARDYEVDNDRMTGDVTFTAIIVEARKIKRNQQPATEK